MSNFFEGKCSGETDCRRNHHQPEGSRNGDGAVGKGTHQQPDGKQQRDLNQLNCNGMGRNFQLKTQTYLYYVRSTSKFKWINTLLTALKLTPAVVTSEMAN